MQVHTSRFTVGAVALFATLLVARAAAAASFERKPYAMSVTGTSMVLKWEQPWLEGGSTVTYGPKNGATASKSEAGATNGHHEVVITGLQPGTRYAYTVDLGGGATASGELTTAVAASVPFSFIFYGDNRTNDNDHKSVVAAMLKEGVDFLVNTGDIVDLPVDTEFDKFFQLEEALLLQNALFVTLGNHEYGLGTGLPYWQDDFANPTTSSGTERYYDFDWGNSRFFILDFNTMSSQQNSWLQTRLADARQRGLVHLFAVMHHSPYDSGNHGENTAAQQQWVPLFQQYNVDLIVGGHDHDYERGFVAATNQRYIVTGGGGAPLYSSNSMKPYQQKFISTLHYVKVSVNGLMVTVTALQPDGTVIDTLSWSVAGPMPDLAMSNVDAAAAPSDAAVAPDDAAAKDAATAAKDGGLVDAAGAKPADLKSGGGGPDLTAGRPPVNTGCSCALAGRAPTRTSPGILALGLLAIALLGWRRSRAR